jgi:exopolysaccharide biosynthesis protein
VVVDGRQHASAGLEMWELSQLMYDLGCVEAFNLDGGSTSIMTYGNEFYSSPAYGGRGRHNPDFLYIYEPAGSDGYYYGG